MADAPSRSLRSSRGSRIALIIAAVAGIAIAIWLTVAPNFKKPVADPTQGAPISNDPREATRAEVPEALALPPDSVAPGTRDAAAALPPDPTAAAAAIAQARKDGTLPARPFPGPAAGCPRMAGELGEAMTKKQVMQATSFELATFLGGVLRTRGAEVEYGAVPKSRFDATELLARRFVVRVKGQGGTAQPWLSPDGGAIEGAVALSDLDLLGYVLAYRSLGAVARSDVETASRAAGFARRLLPDDPAIAFVVGDAQALNQLPDDARRTYEKAATINADAMTWYRLGQRARIEQRPFKADEYFKKAIAADATFAAPHVGLAELVLERLDVTPPDEHPPLVEAAKAFIAAAEKADPNAAGIRLVKAHTTTLDGKDTEAMALLQDELKLHPEQALSYVVLANALVADHKDEEALKLLEAARANGHETQDVLEGLGQLYVMAQRYDDAKKVLVRALELDPESPTYRVQLAQLASQEGKLQETRRLLEEQMAKFPDDPTAALLLAQVELGAEQPDKAKLYVQKILQKDPTHREAIVLDYFIGVVQGQPSLDARAKAIATMGTRRKLAELLQENGLTQEAEVVLTDALTTEPDDLVVPVLLVMIYTVTNRIPEATALQSATLAKVSEPDKRAELEKSFASAIAQALQAQGAPLTP